MTLPSLTKGALLEIYKGNNVDNPICQVMNMKKFPESERYGVQLSDSTYMNSFTVLGPQFDKTRHNGTFADFSIIEIKDYVLGRANRNNISRRIMIILAVKQLVPGSDVGRIIGNPIDVVNHVSQEGGGAIPGSPSGNSTAAQKRPGMPAVSNIPEKRRLIDSINSGSNVVTYNLITIAAAGALPAGEIVDVIGIVKDVGAVITVTAKASLKEFTKRDVQLVDMSKAQITLTLWSQKAENFSVTDQPVIAVKGARMTEFNGGKSLGTSSSTFIQIDPDHPDAHRLRTWWSTVGPTEEMTYLSKGLDDAE